jgi:hypothetical protein
VKNTSESEDLYKINSSQDVIILSFSTKLRNIPFVHYPAKFVFSWQPQLIHVLYCIKERSRSSARDLLVAQTVI